MTGSTTTKRSKKPDILQPVIHPGRWYWASDLRRVFLMGRDTIAQVKRLSPDDVIKTRRGDALRGIAVIKYFKTHRSTRAVTS